MPRSGSTLLGDIVRGPNPKYDDYNDYGPSAYNGVSSPSGGGGGRLGGAGGGSVDYQDGLGPAGAGQSRLIISDETTRGG